MLCFCVHGGELRFNVVSAACAPGTLRRVRQPVEMTLYGENGTERAVTFTLTFLPSPMAMSTGLTPAHPPTANSGCASVAARTHRCLKAPLQNRRRKKKNSSYIKFHPQKCSHKTVRKYMALFLRDKSVFLT